MKTLRTPRVFYMRTCIIIVVWLQYVYIVSENFSCETVAFRVKRFVTNFCRFAWTKSILGGVKSGKVTNEIVNNILMYVKI